MADKMSNSRTRTTGTTQELAGPAQAKSGAAGRRPLRSNAVEQKDGDTEASGANNGPDGSEDVCSLCWFGGTLIVCDAPKCTKVYHARCLSIKPPHDDEPFYCPSHACCICGAADEAMPASAVGQSVGAPGLVPVPLVKCKTCPSSYCARCKPDTVALVGRLAPLLVQPAIAEDAFATTFKVHGGAGGGASSKAQQHTPGRLQQAAAPVILPSTAGRGGVEAVPAPSEAGAAGPAGEGAAAPAAGRKRRRDEAAREAPAAEDGAGEGGDDEAMGDDAGEPERQRFRCEALPDDSELLNETEAGAADEGGEGEGAEDGAGSQTGADDDGVGGLGGGHGLTINTDPSLLALADGSETPSGAMSANKRRTLAATQARIAAAAQRKKERAEARAAALARGEAYDSDSSSASPSDFGGPSSARATPSGGPGSLYSPLKRRSALRRPLGGDARADGEEGGSAAGASASVTLAVGASVGGASAGAPVGAFASTADGASATPGSAFHVPGASGAADAASAVDNDAGGETPAESSGGRHRRAAAAAKGREKKDAAARRGAGAGAAAASSGGPDGAGDSESSDSESEGAAAAGGDSEGPSAATVATSSKQAGGRGASTVSGGPWSCPNCACPTARMRLAKQLETIWAYVACHRAPDVCDLLLAPVTDATSVGAYLGAGYTCAALGLTEDHAAAVRAGPLAVAAIDADAPSAADEGDSDMTCGASVASAVVASAASALDRAHVWSLLCGPYAGNELAVIPSVPVCLSGLLAIVRSGRYRSTTEFVRDLTAMENALAAVSGSRNGSEGVSSSPYPSFVGATDESAILGVSTAGAGAVGTSGSGAGGSALAGGPVDRDPDSYAERYYVAAQTICGRLRAALVGKRYRDQLSAANRACAAAPPASNSPEGFDAGALAAVGGGDVDRDGGALCGLSPAEAAARVMSARRSCLRPELSLTHRPPSDERRSMEEWMRAVGEVKPVSKAGSKAVLAESVGRALASRRKPILTSRGPESKGWADKAGELVQEAVMEANAASIAAAASAVASAGPFFPDGSIGGGEGSEFPSRAGSPGPGRDRDDEDGDVSGTGGPLAVPPPAPGSTAAYLLSHSAMRKGCTALPAPLAPGALPSAAAVSPFEGPFARFAASELTAPQPSGSGPAAPAAAAPVPKQWTTASDWASDYLSRHPAAGREGAGSSPHDRSGSPGGGPRSSAFSRGGGRGDDGEGVSFGGSGGVSGEAASYLVERLVSAITGSLAAAARPALQAPAAVPAPGYGDRWGSLLQQLLPSAPAASNALAGGSGHPSSTIGGGVASSDPVLDSLLATLSASLPPAPAPVAASPAGEPPAPPVEADAPKGEPGGASDEPMGAPPAAPAPPTDAAPSSAGPSSAVILAAPAPAAPAAASRESLLLATVLHLARRLDSTQTTLAGFQAATAAQLTALQVGMGGVMASLAASARAAAAAAASPVAHLNAQLAAPDGADGVSYTSYSALARTSGGPGADSESLRATLLGLGRRERDALLTLSEMAPAEVDDGCDHLRDLLPPSSSEVTGLIEDTASHMRRALRGVGELRSAWVASRRALFAVPAPMAAEARLVIPVGQAAASGMAPRWEPVYGEEDEDDGGAFGGAGAGGCEDGRNGVVDIDEYAMSQAAATAVSGAAGSGEGGASSDGGLARDLDVMRAGVRYGYNGAAGADTGASGTQEAAGPVGVGLGGSGMITVGEGRFALECAASNASLRAHVRALEAQLAARDMQLASLRVGNEARAGDNRS